MLRTLSSLLLFCAAALSAIPLPAARAAEMPIEEAWKALPKYQYGQDMAALLTIDREVIRAMAAPARRAACARRLAGLLEAAGTTSAAKQYICCRLRQVGTAAEVPVLTRLLARPETSQIARYALESIPGEESAAALRNALSALKGELLVGVINSVAARKDLRSVGKLKELAASKDAKVASAALWALSAIASPEAIAIVEQQAGSVGDPLPMAAAVRLLRCADALAAGGHVEAALPIYTRLTAAAQVKGVRRAALGAMLRLQGEKTTETILSWLSGADADRRIVAAARLTALSDAELDSLTDRLAELPEKSQISLLEVVALHKGKDALPLAVSAARSGKVGLRLAGIHMLGKFGDATTVAIVLDSLAAGGRVAEAAQQAICDLPRNVAEPALLAALTERPDIRGPIIRLLDKLDCHEAMAPLLAIAGRDDPKDYGPALDALRGIATTEEDDLSRLVKLLLATSGKHCEAVERTVFLVCASRRAPQRTVPGRC